MADLNSLGLTIVAIPREDDYVWKVSSEKVPHMTLLFLGEMNVDDLRLAHMTNFIEHAASQLSRFGMSVDYRGKLGDKDADVLFFEKSFSFKMLENFRTQLLADQDIYKAYHSTTPYPEWMPHLTLGYPETPAKADKRDYTGINWVEFDRIALWTSDSDGPTFQLKSFDGQDLEVSMSNVKPGTDLEEVLAHYGVKGMKWGKRKTRQTEATSEDSKRATDLKVRVKTQKTTKPLSNDDLEAAIKRMRLEQEFSKLSGGIDKTRKQKVGQFVAKLLIDTGKQTATQVTQSESKKFVDEQLRKTRV